ncbi:uncharacterized protein LOC115786601 [Archocentrus centrarchus]|uniref:uncharacterized protein LOC115786601 n=1 Tax=Archocentrus centrarchus TaxID=63155 RepID=UPI0011E9D5F7|nr:uncharacterized protein LOC115786601 [Archocentrus centrarchus]XP_030594697.1 uncharacterized protein LOC115786601 [Archocentrus centrarchus]XP_030594708.1 uncharacterized protein LOC115786601 [Archocentrus centrarchus]
MERDKKSLSLFILLPLLLVCRSDECPSLPDNLTCYNDYSKNITCLWNSTYVTDHTDAACTIQVKYQADFLSYSASCHLEPVDISRPALKTCSLIFISDHTFSSFHVLSFNLSCNHMKPVITSYKPYCHIRVNPPGRPEVNFTTISWLSQLTKHSMISSYKTEVQWKQQDQSWSDPAVQKNTGIQCEHECEAELKEESLIRGERYEARVRVKSDEGHEGAWSDWSPTVSWVSAVGKRKPPSGITFVVPISIVGVVVLLAVVLFSTNKTTWVYIGKKITGPPIPDPGKSFLQDVQRGFSLHFTSESFHSFLKPVEMITVELTSSVDAVTACRPDEKIVINKGSYDSTNSSFSNPSYSELCTPPISSLSAGNLKPCATDTPYGPVGTQGEGKSTEQESNEGREKEHEMVKLLLKGSSNSEPVQVISDYEKSEKLNIDRFRLQSLDSGMSSCEEVSEDSMEADSMNMTDSYDEDPEGEDEKEGENEQKAGFQKLFGGKSDKFIQVCSDYERVGKPPADSPELPSLDSGVCSGGEEQMSQDESMEDVDKSTESTHFLFPPHPPRALPCSLLSFPQLPLNLCGPGLRPALQLQPSPMLQGFALMSAGRSLEPSGDGYMPVKQEG